MRKGRKPRFVPVNQQIADAKEKVAAAKKAYEDALAELEELEAKKAEEDKKKLLEELSTSTKSIDEIIAFMRGEAYIESPESEDNSEEDTEEGAEETTEENSESNSEEADEDPKSESAEQ